MNSNSTILRIENVSKQFGGLRAIDQVSFGLREGQIKAIIGPNGAGKTTLFNLISGTYPVSNGTVHLKEKNITGMRPYRINSLGISRTFQLVKLFYNMTVLENVMVGRHTKTRSEIFSSAFRLKRTRKEEVAIRDDAMKTLAVFGLENKAMDPSDSLTLGEQKMLEVARALASEPEILLLDEPVAGLNDAEVEDFENTLKKIQQMGITILLVEHHMGFVLGISDEIVVLNYGVKIAEGAPREIQNNEDVIAAYLGKGTRHAES